MVVLALGLAVQLSGGLATQLANGIEAREVYQNNQLVARGIELNETINGKQHFFSHAESSSNAVTEVDAWSDADGHPISARYLLKSGDDWTLTSVEVEQNQVVMVRTSSSDSSPKTFTAELPKGRVSMLAQFDPLKVTRDSGPGKSKDVTIIDPTSMTVSKGSLVEQDIQEPTKVFNLSAGSFATEIQISDQGRLVLERNSAGQLDKSVPWNDGYTEMARRAGIGLDKLILAGLQPNIGQTQTPITRRRAGGN